MVLKNPTFWIPQPIGAGYVTTTTPLNLQTQTNLNLTDQNGNILQTGTNSVVGKYPTTWADTGS